MKAVQDIPGLWDLWQAVGGGDNAVRLSVIDGPVDLKHPCFRGASIEIGRVAGLPVSDEVRSEHGTHVTSIILGQPDSPVVGVAPNCSATVLSIYCEDLNGELEPTSQAEVARAINAAMAQGADIINISSGQLTQTGQGERILADAVHRCAEAGSVIIAAAGNDGCRCLQVPAALEGVLAVGACDLTGNPLSFSNFGDDYRANGVLAPGENVEGASPSALITERSGTSYSAPIVSGVAALLLSLLRRQGRTTSAQEVRKALLTSALRCEQGAGSERCLAGRLNVGGVVEMLLHTDASVPVYAMAKMSTGANKCSDFRDAIQTSMQPANIKEGDMSDSEVEATGQSGSDVAFRPASAGAAVSVEAELPRSGADAGNGGAADGASSAPASKGQSTSGLQGQATLTSAMSAQGTPSYVMMPVYGMPWIGHSGAVFPHSYQHATAAPVVAGGAQEVVAQPTPVSAPTALAVPTTVAPSAEGCECSAVRPAQSEIDMPGEKVFVIGRLFYDFGMEARLDYFVHSIAAWRDSLTGRGEQAFGPDRDKAGDLAAPYNPEVMVRFLLNLAPGEKQSPMPLENMPNANALIWTLTIDQVPIYALDAQGVYGSEIFTTFVLALWFQEVAKEPPTEFDNLVRDADTAQSITAFPPRGRITRISQAGHIVGTTILLNGVSVPSLRPVWRGTYTWDLTDILGADPPDGAQEFLERIYNEFRNVGVSAQDRALNYSAMNAKQTKKIFDSMVHAGMRLDVVEIDRSTICRFDSECWDVTYRFFSPTEVLQKARKVFQYTIDVSDTVPVPVGRLREWEVA